MKAFNHDRRMGYEELKIRKFKEPKLAYLPRGFPGKVDIIDAVEVEQPVRC